MGYRDRKTEAAGTGAARIDVQYAPVLVGTGLMGVATDHYVAAHGRGVQILNPVKNVNASRTCFYHCRGGQCGCPLSGVDVTADGHYGRDGAETFQYLRPAHVTGMDDQVRPLKRPQGVFPHQSVCIGNQPDGSHSVSRRPIPSFTFNPLGC